MSTLAKAKSLISWDTSNKKDVYLQGLVEDIVLMLDYARAAGVVIPDSLSAKISQLFTLLEASDPAHELLAEKLKQNGDLDFLKDGQSANDSSRMSSEFNATPGKEGSA